jgi:hypothetical protein
VASRSSTDADYLAEVACDFSLHHSSYLIRVAETVLGGLFDLFAAEEPFDRLRANG